MFDIVSYIDIAGYITSTNESLQTHNDIHLGIRRAMTARTAACAPVLLSLAAVVVAVGGLAEAGAHYENSHQYLEVDMDILDYEVREYDEFNVIRVELEIDNQEEFDIWRAQFFLGGVSDADDPFSTASEFQWDSSASIRGVGVDASDSDCAESLPNLTSGSSGRISTCYVVGKTFEPDGLRLFQTNTYHNDINTPPPYDPYHSGVRVIGGVDPTLCFATNDQNAHTCSGRTQVVPFHADSSYCALYGSYCNSSAIQDVGSLPKINPKPEPLAHATLLYTLYNNNTGTLTMVFDRPVVAQNPGRIGLIHDIAAYIDDGTAPGLGDAELSTVDNKRQSAVLAFALSEDMRLDVAESLRTYGDLALLIRSGAVYSADGFEDVTAHTGAILVDDLVIVR